MVLSCVAAITIDVIIIATEASIVQNCKEILIVYKYWTTNLVKLKVIKIKLYIKSFLLRFYSYSRKVIIQYGQYS